MKNSIKKPQDFTVVFGSMAYDEEKEQIECPPSTVNNKKMLPKYKVPMQEGDMIVNISEWVKYNVNNGKIVSVEDRRKGNRKVEETAKYKDDKITPFVDKNKVIEFQGSKQEDSNDDRAM